VCSSDLFNKGNIITKVKVKVDLHDNDISCDKWKIITNNNEVIPLIDALETTSSNTPDFKKVQTAVDWFANEIDNLLPYVNEKTAKQFNDLLEKAKAIQQQHIEDAFDAGVSSVLKNFDKAYSDIDGETYYKQNFK
jgi:ribosome biogenesis GTPase A